MVKQFNAPVTIQVYLGSGKTGEKIRENIVKMASGGSISEVVVKLLKKAEPRLFKGADDGSK